MKMKTEKLGFVIFLAAVALFYIRTLQKTSATIVNQAGKALKILTIKLCGESATMENIPVQTSKNLELKVHSDCHYQVECVPKNYRLNSRHPLLIFLLFLSHSRRSRHRLRCLRFNPYEECPK